MNRFLCARLGGFAIGTLVTASLLQAGLYDGDPYYAPGSEDFGAAEYVVGPSGGAYGSGKWGSSVLGTGATVTWSIMNPGLSVGFESPGVTTVALGSIMPVGYLDEIRSAFAAWSALADLTFVEVVDSGVSMGQSGATGDIRIGAHPMDGAAGTLAHGYYPKAFANLGYSVGGDIHFDSAEMWDIGFAGLGYDLFQVVAHEIGHALGLNHSLTSLALMYGSYTEAFRGPQADDQAGAQYLYGAPESSFGPLGPSASVPEASPWAVGLVLGFGVAGIWRARRR